MVCMIRVHKIKLNPNSAQSEYFGKACGVARHAYNWALGRWIEQYEAGLKPSELALRREYYSGPRFSDSDLRWKPVRKRGL
jgi:putative transposase